MTNPDVIDIATRDIQRQLEERPSAEAISVSPNDYVGRNCQCENCRAVAAQEEGETGLLIHFVNAVAMRIEQSHPHVLITTLAYMETVPPPNIPVLAANLRIFRDHNVGGHFVQTNETERREMKAWILKKLLWDPSRNAWDLMHDFVHGYFGRAGPAVAEYNEILYIMSANTNRELLWGPELEGREIPEWLLAADVGPYGARFKPSAGYLSRAFLGACNEVFDRAEAMAENEAILHRVLTERLPIIYCELYQIDEALKKGDRLDELEYFVGLIDRFEKIAALSGRDGHGELGERGRHQGAEWYVAELRKTASSIEPPEAPSAETGTQKQ